MPRIVIDHELVLNRWAAGDDIEAVRRAAGTLNTDSVLGLISEARRAGDPRAARRPKRGGSSVRDAMAVSVGKLIRRRKLGKLPVNPIQIMQAVAAYSGPVTVCKPGFHAGHSPKCLHEIGL